MKRISPYGESKHLPKYERRVTFSPCWLPVLLTHWDSLWATAQRAKKWLLHSMRALLVVGQEEVFTEGDILWPHFHSEVKVKAKWLPTSGFCTNSPFDGTFPLHWGKSQRKSTFPFQGGVGFLGNQLLTGNLGSIRERKTEGRLSSNPLNYGQGPPSLKVILIRGKALRKKM